MPKILTMVLKEIGKILIFKRNLQRRKSTLKNRVLSIEKSFRFTEHKCIGFVDESLRYIWRVQKFSQRRNFWKIFLAGFLLIETSCIQAFKILFAVTLFIISVSFRMFEFNLFFSSACSFPLHTSWVVKKKDSRNELSTVKDFIPFENQLDRKSSYFSRKFFEQN